MAQRAPRRSRSGRCGRDCGRHLPAPTRPPTTEARMTLTIEHPDWMLDAECTRADPGLFYPEPVSWSVDAAKKICADCTVTAQCLAYALTHGELNVGVWGGLSVTER